MLIMHVFFASWHENCGCYGKGNIQNCAKTYGSRHSSYPDETWYLNRLQCSDCAPHFFRSHMKLVVAPVGELCVAVNTCVCCR